MADLDNIPTLETIQNFNKDVKVHTEVVTSTADKTVQLDSAGKNHDTLNGLRKKYLEAIQAAGGVPLGDGVWGVGKEYTAYNQYLIYNGVPYKPRASATLPYATQTADPTVAPDVTFVQPYTDFSKLDGRALEERALGPGASLYQGDSGVVQDGDIVPAGTTHLTILINGRAEDVRFYPLSDGVVGSLTESGASIGGVPVLFNSSLKSITVGSLSELKSITSPVGSKINYIDEDEDRVYVVTSDASYPRVALDNGLYAARVYQGDTIVMNEDDWNVVVGGWHLPPYTTNEYDIAFNNGKSIQAACEYADELGISKVIGPKGVLTVCYYDADNSELFFGRDVEAQRGLESLDYSPSITLFDMTNLTLDLSKTSLQVIFDSDNRSPYDLIQRSTPANMYGKLIFPRKTENLTIIFSNENSCIGDVRCRSWLTDPVNVENTYGVFISQMNYNMKIYGGKGGGFTADFISGGFGQPCGEGYPYPTLQSLARGGFDDNGLEDDALLTNRRSEFIQLRFLGGEDDLTNFNIRDNICSLSGFGYIRYPYIRNDNIGVYFYDESQAYLARKTVGFNDAIYCPDNVHYLRFEFYDDERTDEFVNYGDIVADSGAMTLQTGISTGVLIEDMDVVDNRRGGISNVPYSTTIRNVRVFDSGLGEKLGDPSTTEFTRYAINCEDFVTNDLIIENVTSSHSYVNGFLISSTKSTVRDCEVDTSVQFRRDCLEGLIENTKASTIDTGNNNIPDRQKMRPKIAVNNCRGWDGLNSVQHGPNTGPSTSNRKKELVIDQGNKFTDDVYTDCYVSGVKTNRLQGFAIGGRYSSIGIVRNTPFSNNADTCSLDLSGAKYASDIYFDSTGPEGTIPNECILFNRHKNPYKDIRIDTSYAIRLDHPMSAQSLYWDLENLYMNDVTFTSLNAAIENKSANRASITPPSEAYVVGGSTYNISKCKFDNMMMTVNRMSGATTNATLIIEDTTFAGVANIILSSFSGTDVSNVTIIVKNSNIDVSLRNSSGFVWGSVNDEANITLSFIGCTFYNELGGVKSFDIIDITHTAATISSNAYGCTFANCTNIDGVTVVS